MFLSGGLEQGAPGLWGWLAKMCSIVRKARPSPTIYDDARSVTIITKKVNLLVDMVLQSM